jgi:chromosomal replication initiator protein
VTAELRKAEMCDTDARQHVDDIRPVTGVRSAARPFSLNMAATTGGDAMAMTSKTDAGQALFSRVTKKLKARVGAEVFSSWFGRMKLVEASRSVVRLSVPTTFLRSWINSHYLVLITDLWREENPELLKLELIVRSAARVRPLDEHSDRPEVQTNTASAKPARAADAISVPAASAPAVMHAVPQQRSTLGSPLDSRYTFETYVEGAANRVALAAARAVIENDSGIVRFNPLYVYAAVGLGKTHLLQAIANAALAKKPKARIVYLTAEYFMWRFAKAIKDNHALVFKEQLRDIDLLVIDDMQFLQGHQIQHEFCHLINLLLDSARQVVVAADRPVGELDSLEPRIKSRLSGGVAIGMTAPDFEMRLEILRQRLAVAQGEDVTLEVPEDVLVHIARTVSGSGRELEGAFNQLLFRRSFEPDISVERVDSLIGQLYRSGDPKRIRIEDIQRIVARHFNVSRTELVSARRTRTVVKPRQVAMYLAKIMTPRSLPEIGRRFGNRDHTTVLHAVRKVEGLAKEDTKLEQELELLQRLIQEQG